MAISLFISYAQRDDTFCVELLTFLQPIISQGQINCWHMGMLAAGDDMRRERIKRLSEGQIILCMLSPDYFGGSLEEEIALINQEYGRGAIVLPVMVRKTPLYAPFENLQVLPRNLIPVSAWPSHDDAWDEVIASVRNRLQQAVDSLAIPLQQYHSYQIRTYGTYGLGGHLDPFDAPDAPAALGRLELFVQPDVKRTPPLTDLPWWPDGIAGSKPILTAFQEVQWLFLMGMPGAGKTEFMLWLMATLGNQKDDSNNLPAELVPVYVDLRSFAAARQGHVGDGYNFFTYIDRIHREVSLDLREKQMGLLARTGRLLWLFDGLDEISHQERQPIAAMIAGLAARGGRGIVTCRLVEARQVWGTLEQVGFEAYTLLPFDDQRIHQLITLFYKIALSDSKEVRRMEQRLWQSLTDIPALRELCRNPLLLILLLLYNQHEDLPRRQHQIYQKAVARMADRWNAPAHFELDDKLACLRELAWWMQVELPGGDGNLVARGTLVEWTTHFCERRYSLDRDVAQQRAQQLLDGLRRRSGILVQLSKDTFGFVHKSFLEYLAAEAAVRKIVGEPLRQLYRQRWQSGEGWREILAILCGLLDEREMPDQVIGALQENLHQIPFADRYSHIAFVTFAISCVAEVGPVHREPMRSFIKLLGQLARHAIKALLYTPEIPLDSEVISWGEEVVMPLTRAMQAFGSRWADAAAWQAWALDEDWQVAPQGMREQVYLCAIAAVGREQLGEFTTALLEKEGGSRAMLFLLAGIKSIEIFQDKDLVRIKQVLIRRAQVDWLEVILLLGQLKKIAPNWSMSFDELGIADRVNGVWEAGIELVKSSADEEALAINFQSLLKKMLPADIAEELTILLGSCLSQVGAAFGRVSQTKNVDAEAFKILLDLAGRAALAHAPILRKLAWAGLEYFADKDPIVLHKIEEMVVEGTDERVRLRAAIFLDMRREPVGRRALWQLARTSAHEHVRLEAALLLSMNPDPLSGLAPSQILLELARDGRRGQTRAQAIYALAPHSSQDSVVQDALLQWAETDRNEEVRLAAALMLKRWIPAQSNAGRRVAAELSRCAQEEAVRCRAAEEVAAYPELDHLRQTAHSPNIRLRAESAIGLLRLRAALLLRPQN